MEDLYPRRQFCLQKKNKLLICVTNTRIVFSPLLMYSAVLQEIQELFILLPIPRRVQYLEEQIIWQKLGLNKEVAGCWWGLGEVEA